MTSQTKENYLKAVFSLDRDRKEISITALSEKLQVSKSTINSMVKRMESAGWVDYEKYQPIQLTKKGKSAAALIVRKHRLAEMFLVEIMGFGWEEVHVIAEEMEHLSSEKFFDRIDEILGFPTVDPHGSPIPDKEGNINQLTFINLSTVPVGSSVILRGLTNSSKELLTYLNKKEIKLGMRMEVTEMEEFDKSVSILLDGKQCLLLSQAVTQCLLVETD